jgi:hypothetical protein
MRKIFLLTTLLLFSFTAYAQDLTINGLVLEKGTKTPLQDVTVSVQDDASLTSHTDKFGHFSLALPKSGSYILQATSGENETAYLAIHFTEDAPPSSPTLYLTPTTVLAEVQVRGERSPDKVSKSVISGAELRQVAGSGGDPLNALQSLPGVASDGSSSAPAVRGTGPGDNYFYVDGLPSFKIFHLGAISVFNADLISDFSLYAAAFSSHYANVTGAVIDVALRNPRTDRLGAKLNANWLGADFLVEGPVKSNQSFFFAARRSYLDLLIKPIAKDGVTLQIPNYRDYQGKYLWQVNDNHRVSFHLQGAGDNLKLKFDSTSDAAQQQPILAGDATFADGYAMQAVVLDSVLANGNAFNKLALEHIGFHFTNSVGTAGNIYLEQNVTMLREQINLPFNDDHELSLAGNVNHQVTNIQADIINPTCTQFNPNCDLTTAPKLQLVDQIIANGWDISAQDRKKLTSQFTLVSGLRHSGEDYLHRQFTEPRIGLEWQRTENTLLTAGWGRHNQLPTGQEVARTFGNPKLDHLRAEHSVVGIAQKLPDNWSWKAETYYKKLSNIIVDDNLLNYNNGGSGKAYGAELLIKKAATEKLSGWLSVSVSKSQRHNDITGESFRFEYDQPLNTTLVATYKSDVPGVSLSVKWNYHSGAPYTPIYGTSGTFPDSRPMPVYGAVNSGTLPAYHRLDLRLDRNYVYNTWKLNTYFELNNAYQRQNVVGYSYDPTYTKKTAITTFVIPFNFGVQAEF